MQSEYDMYFTAIEALIKKFNNASPLNESEHSIIRSVDRYSFIYFNCETFINGFNGDECSFLVLDSQKFELLDLKGNWELNANKIGIDLFQSIQYKLSYKFKSFFEFHDDLLIKLSEQEIINRIVKFFLQQQQDFIASEDEIMLELIKKFPCKRIKFSQLDRTLILPRICAGKNEFNKNYYFYNDGCSINDISLIDRNMSVQRYISFLEQNNKNNLSLVEVSRLFFIMYSGFKVHTLIVNWHRKFGYNLNFEIAVGSTNLIFEKYIFRELQTALNNNLNMFEISENMLRVHRNNSILWLIQNVFTSIRPNETFRRFSFRFSIEGNILTMYGQSNLILLIPFVFKKLFFSWEEIRCIGIDYEYSLTKYKKVFNVKFNKL